MAIKFTPDTNTYITIPDANFLDHVSSFSFSLWVRFDLIVTEDKNYAFSHRGIGTSPNQFSLRKDSTSDKIRFSVTAGSVNKTCDSTTTAVEGTVYHVVGTWSQADEMKIYIDRDLEATTSTTAQTEEYDSGGARPLLWNTVRLPISSLGDCTIGQLTIWTDHIVLASQADTLFCGSWPAAAAGKQPAVFYSCLDGLPALREPDWSGHGRNIESDGIVGSPTRVGPDFSRLGSPTAALDLVPVITSAQPSPHAWVAGPLVDHPEMSATITGLDVDTAYELRMTASDVAGNVSQPSATAESEAGAAGIMHVSKDAILAHPATS